MDKRNRDSYIHALAKRGMLFTDSHGVTHPSLPNYLALFRVPRRVSPTIPARILSITDNLASSCCMGDSASQLIPSRCPKEGDLGCVSGAYHRKHNPVSNWQVPGSHAGMNRRFADFPGDFSRLPTISFVIPDQDNDMHDGSFEAADHWLKTRIEPYVAWAIKHNSLLILTWDEDDFRAENHVVTILVGPMVKQGDSMQRINHYSVLRTLLDFYGLPALGRARMRRRSEASG